LSGGAARSRPLRSILAATLDAPVRVATREEAGTAGAAMIASVSIGAYKDMDAAIADWVTPTLGPVEAPDPALVAVYDRLYDAYLHTRNVLEPVWDRLADARN
jgi:erythritol kinase